MVAAYEPDYATPPGWILQEVLDERSMNQADLARRPLLFLSIPTVDRWREGLIGKSYRCVTTG